MGGQGRYWMQGSVKVNHKRRGRAFWPCWKMGAKEEHMDGGGKVTCQRMFNRGDRLATRTTARYQLKRSRCQGASVEKLWEE